MEWPNLSTGVNEKVVVLAGGWYKVLLSSVQLLFIDESGNFSSGWVSGPSLPITAALATLILYHNSVILIGGENGEWIKNVSTKISKRQSYSIKEEPERASLAACFISHS